ncbi:MAG TPA: hypothetical protein PLZ51_23405 [Aggregatilineales bacterium]|nr:hypothetical protein [Aggregatilineales bacterium]
MPRILIASLDQTRPLAQKLLESLSKYYQSIGMLSDDSQTASQSIPVADMLLVVMNKEWATDIAQNPPQFTAIADALRRSDLPVMAILADDTTMPTVTTLAPEHRAIAYMSAVTIHSTSDSFDADVLTLARQMAGYIKETSPEGYSAQTGRALTAKQKLSRLTYLSLGWRYYWVWQSSPYRVCVAQPTLSMPPSPHPVITKPYRHGSPGAICNLVSRRD